MLPNTWLWYPTLAAMQKTYCFPGSTTLYVYISNKPRITRGVLYIPIMLIIPLLAYAIGLMSGCGTASNLLNWSL